MGSRSQLVKYKELKALTPAKRKNIKQKAIALIQSCDEIMRVIVVEKPAGAAVAATAKKPSRRRKK